MTAKGATRPRLSAVPKPAKPPHPPRDLKLAGKATWRSCWSLPQIFYPNDVLAVSRLARLEDEASALRAAIIESGSTLKRQVQNSRGEVIGHEPYIHPALGQLRRIGIEVAELCSALGLSPVARHNLGLEVSTREPDNVDRLKERRRKRRAAAGIGV